MNGITTRIKNSPWSYDTTVDIMDIFTIFPLLLYFSLRDNLHGIQLKLYVILNYNDNFII